MEEAQHKLPPWEGYIQFHQPYVKNEEDFFR